MHSYVPLILMRHLCSEASSYALLHQAKALRITTETEGQTSMYGSHARWILSHKFWISNIYNSLNEEHLGKEEHRHDLN